MERILNIVESKDFNIEFTNLLIDLYSKDCEKYFKELNLDIEYIDKVGYEIIEKLTKLASVIEYVGNLKGIKDLPEWIFDERLILKEAFSPGLSKDNTAWLLRIVRTPKEFAKRLVFYDVETLKPM